MTLRRYGPMRSSPGTVIPLGIRREVLALDNYECVGGKLGWPSHTPDCGPVELDHVRASHGMGMKSETTLNNLVTLGGACHRWKTNNGRLARPKLLAYIATRAFSCGHVDPNPSCDGPCQRRVPA